MGNDATVTLRGEGGPLRNELSKAQGDVEAFGSKIKSILTIVGTAFVAKKVFDWTKSFVEAGAESEAADAKLSAALRSSGEAAGYTIDQLKAMASELQKTTNIEDETFEAAMTLASGFKNIRGDHFKQLMQLGADASKMMGGDLVSAVDKYGKMLNNPLRGMAMLEREGVVFTKAQEEMITAMVEAGDVAGAQGVMLDMLSEKYAGQAAAAADTYAGRMEALKLQFGDMGEEIGGALLPVLEKLMPLMSKFGEFLEASVIPVVTEMIDSFVACSDTITGYLMTAFEVAVDGCVGLYTAFQYMQDACTVALEGLVLGVVKTFNVISYQLTEAAPAYVKWFGENWANMLFDMLNASKKIFDNMFTNITGFFKAVWGWLKGEGFDYQWTGLLEGFESTMAALPEIAERKKGDFEAALEKDLDQNVGKLSMNNLLKRLDENRKAARKAMGLDKEESAGGLEEGGAETGTDMTPSAAALAKPYEVAKQPKEEKEKKSKDDDFKASMEDLESLSKRIASAAASSTTDQKLDKVKGAVEEKGDAQIEVAKSSKTSLDKIASTLDKIQAQNESLANQLTMLGTLA